MTLDHGPQRVLWSRRGKTALHGPAHSRPVLIRAGALGPGIPARNLVVSSHHRVLAGGRGQLASVFESEVLVPAKALTVLPGIRHMRGKSEIEWIHFAFARHQIVLAENSLSEPLLFGPMVMNRLSRMQRAEAEMLFGPEGNNNALNGPPARPLVSVRTARQALTKYRRSSEFKTLGKTVNLDAPALASG